MEFNTKPQFVTLASQVFKPLPRDDSRTGEIIEKPVEDITPNVQIVNVSERAAGAVCIEDAEFIVSCGRGIKNKEDIQIIKDLAETLKGEIGCSRPIASDLKWDEDWSYLQEITIPFDTNQEIAKFQPVDMKLEFDNPCWAKKENQHSVRALCWDGSKWHELESQIYNLDYENANFLKRCGLVFLVPEIADGSERYFVYYDNSEKNPTNYIDHVDVEDAYYYYEPISGVGNGIAGYSYNIKASNDRNRCPYGQKCCYSQGCECHH